MRMPVGTHGLLRPPRHRELQDGHHQEHRELGPRRQHPGLQQHEAEDPAELGQRDSGGIAERRTTACRILDACAHPLRDQGDPHDHVADRDRAPVVVVGRSRYAGRQHQDAGHLHHREQPVGDVVGVVGRGEPGEVHPGPPDREEHLQERQDPVERVRLGDPVRELGRHGRDRDHEGQVEQQFELAGDAVRLVDRARGHPHPDPGVLCGQGEHILLGHELQTAQQRQL